MTISREGDAEVIRGLVREGDRKALAAIRGVAERSTAGTVKARSDDTAQAALTDAHSAAGVSEGLAKRLAAHRTMALQAMLSRNTTVALASLAHVLVQRVFGDEYPRAGLALQVSPQLSAYALAAAADDLKGGPAWQAIDAAKHAWKMRLPEPGAWLRWLIELPQTDLIELLALCTALTVNALPGASAAADANALADSVGLDMADWWEPTAQGYLNHVSKAQIVRALKEAGPDLAEDGVGAMKKDVLVVKAVSRLAGKRWLPAQLRRPPG